MKYIHIVKKEIVVDETDSNYFYKGEKVLLLDTTETTANNQFCYIETETDKGWVPLYRLEIKQ